LHDDYLENNYPDDMENLWGKTPFL
jgi:hypothetical protein